MLLRIILLAIAALPPGAAAFANTALSAARKNQGPLPVSLLRSQNCGVAGVRHSRRTTIFASEELPTTSLSIGAAGIIANFVMWASLYCVAKTGGGLPAGPFGVVGALEGVSYLLVVAVCGASLFKKVTSGSGLPAGRFGLIGAAEGLSFLSVVAGLAVLALVASQQECIPNALPLADYSDKVRVCH